jgi:SPP1 gp7 family putative phage head morphogenesis protein
MTWAITPDVERYDEAVDWFQKRTVLTGDQARELDDRLKSEAFWIGGGLQLDQVQRVFDRIATALERGESFDDFRKAVRSQLADPAHTETVFRNATQRAYNAGRYLQMSEPSVLRFRPFWMYDAVLDIRTTPLCKSLNKTLLPAEDEWWDTHWPPLHHRCRSSVRNMRASEAERRGGPTTAPDSKVPDGWGFSPKRATPWRPDPKRNDPGLHIELERKASKRKPRRPRPEAEHEADFWAKRYAERYGDAATTVGHGRASLERGLEMPVKDIREQLARLGAVPGVDAMLESIKELQGSSTLRAQAGELEPLRRAAAALAGHLAQVPERAVPLSNRALEQYGQGRRALKFLGTITAESLQHPVDWSFWVIPGRASASGHEQRIRWNTGEGVLEHEWGHALEFLNAPLLKRAIAFLQARTKGEALRPLAELEKRIGYGPEEVARPDEFIKAYIGKHYEFRGEIFGTEVTSMAVELLVAGRTHWGTLEQLLRYDPEHFYFLLGQLANR